MRDSPTQAVDEDDDDNPPEEPTYTNPHTGIGLTKSELEQLARGDRFNARGDRIFFKPAFLTPDPWARVRTLSTQM